ncbi:hypothetical protein GCM10028781_10930 [Nostocoides australiense]
MFRRLFQRLDPASLDAVISVWMWTTTVTVGGRRVSALDGQTMAVVAAARMVLGAAVTSSIILALQACAS